VKSSRSQGREFKTRTPAALIVDLIEPVKWSSMQADVKGDIYEGLLAKSAEESPKGQANTHASTTIKGIVDWSSPPPPTRCDPGSRHRSFLLAPSIS